VARTASVLVVALLFGAASCTGSPVPPATSSRPPSLPAQSPTSNNGDGRRQIDAGCGGSPIYQGGSPDFAAVNSPNSPYVISEAGNAVGYLFGFRLRAVNSDGTSLNKVLWYVRLPRDGHPLHIEARPRGRQAPVVRSDFPSGASPGEIYPSSVDVPKAGCWHITLTWGPHTDRVDLRFLPALY
jgi:hypothetical protein